jgi:hypothetical protein
MKGWYIPSRPDEVKGESTAWYASFWRFCAAYLEERFGAKWCLIEATSRGSFLLPGNLIAICRLIDETQTARFLHRGALLKS